MNIQWLGGVLFGAVLILFGTLFILFSNRVYTIESLIVTSVLIFMGAFFIHHSLFGHEIGCSHDTGRYHASPAGGEIGLTRIIAADDLYSHERKKFDTEDYAKKLKRLEKTKKMYQELGDEAGAMQYQKLIDEHKESK